MSMLTPPGMGGKKYRITGDRYPRMRRPRHRRRILLGIMAGACALGLVGWGTMQLIDVFGGQGSTAQAAQEKRPCAHDGAAARTRTAQPAAKPPAPASLTVNVYNATPRSGLAKRTADALKQRGFKIGKVGNAPAAYDKKVGGAGILLGPRTAATGPLKVLATQLTGAQLKTDDRKGADLDLIIGSAFQDLATPQQAAKALAQLNRPAPRPAAATC
ncbi:LytR C-terminal domain-containing protein [Streptomyces sp. NPDC057555]|uniref:LytR C-terminal domain-containing protein n=1 Tax=Streptomyces sp. NPDC057555 TaxID=3346166 RepID=UPI00368DD9E6